MQQTTLLVILGPTGVGKTALALDVAQQLQTEIVNADSRQIYRELPIGTAAPTTEEQRRVKHYFVGTHSITEDYNAGQYEREALLTIKQLFLQKSIVILTGGSMMYIDAVCGGLDNLPMVSGEIRKSVMENYQKQGIGWLQTELTRLDKDYAQQVDLHNPQRLIHAIEISLQAGVPYSTLRSGLRKERDFSIVKVGLFRKREILYERINQRVEQMIQQGLEEEARKVFEWRNLNSLNTVGYKEMFEYFDGRITMDEAIALIQQHSRNYAKRQMTWWKSPGRDNLQNSNVDSLFNPSDIHWLDAATAGTEDVLKILNDNNQTII